MGWHKKSFFSVRTAAATGFLGVFGILMGSTEDVAEKGAGRGYPWPDRQTDRQTSLCLYKCVISKIPGILLQMGKHPSINEYLANTGKQCIPINELVLLLTLLTDLFNIFFLFFSFPQYWNIYIYSLQLLESFLRRKKGLVWRFAACPSQAFTDLQGRK